MAAFSPLTIADTAATASAPPHNLYTYASVGGAGFPAGCGNNVVPVIPRIAFALVALNAIVVTNPTTTIASTFTSALGAIFVTTNGVTTKLGT